MCIACARMRVLVSLCVHMFVMIHIKRLPLLYCFIIRVLIYCTCLWLIFQLLMILIKLVGVTFALLSTRKGTKSEFFPVIMSIICLALING